MDSALWASTPLWGSSRADDTDDPQGQPVGSSFFPLLIKRKYSPLDATGKGGGLDRDGVNKGPLKLGLDPRAPGFADQPVDDFLAAASMMLADFRMTLSRLVGRREAQSRCAVSAVFYASSRSLSLAMTISASVSPVVGSLSTSILPSLPGRHCPAIQCPSNPTERFGAEADRSARTA